jgi:hypothetical protein
VNNRVCEQKFSPFLEATVKVKVSLLEIVKRLLVPQPASKKQMIEFPLQQDQAGKRL